MGKVCGAGRLSSPTARISYLVRAAPGCASRAESSGWHLEWGGKSEPAIEDAADVVDGAEVGEEGNEVCEFRIVRVVEPRRDGDRIVRVEDIGSWGVVEDDSVGNGAAELGEVLWVCERKHEDG
jgi:hypothetical protein